MKTLRKTISSILLENQSHYEKISSLMCTGEKENVVQALELAETMGYIGEPFYTTMEWHSGTQHIWKVYDYDQQFWDELEKQYHIATGNQIFKGFTINFWPSRGLMSIGYREIIQ